MARLSADTGRDTREGSAAPRRFRRVVLLIIVALLIASAGYTAYAGYEGSRQLVLPDHARICFTPPQLGWEYEAINYDKADDLRLAAENEEMGNCADQGTAGGEVVAPDGTRLAGWYIPAARAPARNAPTVLVVHGTAGNKSDMLYWGWVAPLHEHYDVVIMDLRDTGRSGGSQHTGGVLEQDDVGAMVNWLETAKDPAHVAVLGLSGGAAAVLARARTDDRIDALILDGVHARAESLIAALTRRAGHPAYPATWAILLGFWLRTGYDMRSVDPIDSLASLDDQPLLLLHGTADTTDIPAESAELMYREARRLGLDVTLEYCEGAEHAQVVTVCAAEYERWVLAFLARVFPTPGSSN